MPAITLGFWCLKIVATTLGETAGDSASIALGLGYAVAALIFPTVFAATAAAQIAATRFCAPLYWATIVASTTVGTTLADFADRSLGVGYTGGSILLLALLGAAFVIRHRALGSIDPGSVATRNSETFYWLTILVSQTLGTALGDWTADAAGLGHLGGVLLFAGLLALVAAAAAWTRLSRGALFWAAFVPTRPLGAVLGDFLDKPLDQGGLALGLSSATAALLVAIVALIACLPQRPASRAH